MEVEGITGKDGAFLVEEVEIKKNQEDDRLKVTGPIQEIHAEGPELLVLGYRIKLDPGCKAVNHTGEKIDPSLLRVGTVVKAYGRDFSHNKLVAKKLRLLDPAIPIKREIEGPIEGPVKKVGREYVFQLVGREARVDRKKGEAVLQGEDEPTMGTARTSDPWLRAVEKKLPFEEELYNVGRDPGESENLSEDHAEEIQKMRDLLAGIRKGGHVHRSVPTRVLDDSEMEALRGLGYIE